jgi:heme/copper-type cytochrome/quinol oxidase subunit 1
MRFKTLVRADLLTYLLAFLSLLLGLNLKHIAVDIQLHDTYFILGFASFYIPLAVVIFVLGVIYSVFIVTKKFPHTALSMSFVILTLVSVSSFTMFLYTPGSILFSERKYYSQTELSPESIVTPILAVIAFAIGLLAYLLSLLMRKK